MLTAWLLGFSRHNQPPQAHAEVKALNDAASSVYRNFGDFVLFVRKQLDLQTVMPCLLRMWRKA
jgi:hypothetical protein